MRKWQSRGERGEGEIGALMAVGFMVKILSSSGEKKLS